MNDLNFRFMLIAKLVWDMEAPKGLKIVKNKTPKLRKTIYGLIQSARNFKEKPINFFQLFDSMEVSLIPVCR
jgi:hypothetical protein